MWKIFFIKARFIEVTKNSGLCLENSFPVIEELNIINTRKRATYDFSALYTTIPSILLIKVLSEIIHFVFISRVRSKIGFLATSIY